MDVPQAPEQSRAGEVVVRPEDRLTPLERAAHDRAVSRNEPAVAAHVSARLYALFLRGTTCAEISRLNKGIGLGQVCRERVADGWDRRRDEYRQELLAATKDRVLQVQLESAEFLANELSAAHKLHGDKAKLYLQGGDEKDLGSFSISSIREYRETLAALRELVAKEPEDLRPDGPAEHERVPAPPAGAPSDVIRAALAARGQR